MLLQAMDELKVLVSKHMSRSKLVTEELLLKSLRARNGKPQQAKRLVKCYLVSLRLRSAIIGVDVGRIGTKY